MADCSDADSRFKTPTCARSNGPCPLWLFIRDLSEGVDCGKESVVGSPGKDLNVWISGLGLKYFSQHVAMNCRGGFVWRMGANSRGAKFRAG